MPVGLRVGGSLTHRHGGDGKAADEQAGGLVAPLVGGTVQKGGQHPQIADGEAGGVNGGVVLPDGGGVGGKGAGYVPGIATPQSHLLGKGREEGGGVPASSVGHGAATVQGDIDPTLGVVGSQSGVGHAGELFVVGDIGGQCHTRGVVGSCRVVDIAAHNESADGLTTLGGRGVAVGHEVKEALHDDRGEGGGHIDRVAVGLRRGRVVDVKTEGHVMPRGISQQKAKVDLHPCGGVDPDSLIQLGQSLGIHVAGHTVIEIGDRAIPPAREDHPFHGHLHHGVCRAQTDGIGGGIRDQTLDGGLAHGTFGRGGS